ncbi:MAG: hypothetical protein HYV16_09010 [Gammaproteobacteria bacterium]|nr:hypothetical protein [Gammaproteobacteria bacterium]
MKLLLSMIPLSMVLAACAQAPIQTQARAEPQVLERVTGSRTAKNVPLVGKQAKTASPVTIIDREEIDRLGVTSLREVLARQPYVH